MYATQLRLTAKGLATRARIVEKAADLLLARGVGGTSLDDIRAATVTSKSQLFHYFPGGKSELVAAIAAFQSERVLAAQQPFLDHLDSWEAWAGWRDAVLAHYCSQAHWGCPIGTLASELSGNDPVRAAEVAACLDRWRGYLEAGLARMRSSGLLRADADPRALALAVFAALHGGLLLTQTMQSAEPLVAALDGALATLRAAAAEPAAAQSAAVVPAAVVPAAVVPAAAESAAAESAAAMPASASAQPAVAEPVVAVAASAQPAAAELAEPEPEPAEPAAAEPDAGPAYPASRVADPR